MLTTIIACMFTFPGNFERLDSIIFSWTTKKQNSLFQQKKKDFHFSQIQEIIEQQKQKQVSPDVLQFPFSTFVPAKIYDKFIIFTG